MKKLLKSAFLAVCFLSLPGLVFAAKKTPVKAIQILPQVELSELSDATLMNIAMWEDFHTLEQFAQTCHRHRILAACTFLLKTSPLHSQVRSIELAILHNYHAIMHGIIDVVMEQNEHEIPNRIKKLVQTNPVDKVIDLAAINGRALDLYVLLSDSNLIHQITPDGASTAILSAYNIKSNPCLFALMSNANIMTLLDQTTLEAILRLVIDNINLAEAILQNKLILKKISLLFLHDMYEKKLNRKPHNSSTLKDMHSILKQAIDRKISLNPISQFCLVQ